MTADLPLHADEARAAIIAEAGPGEHVSFPRAWRHPGRRANTVRGLVRQSFDEDGFVLTLTAVVTARRTPTGIKFTWRYR